MVFLMSLYKKKGKNDLEDEIASYKDMEDDIWEDKKNNSGRKSGSIPRK